MATFTHEKETVFAGSFFAPETTYGDEPASDAVPFKTLGVVPTFVQEKNPITVQGFTLPTGMIAGPESTTWQGDGVLNVDEIGFFAGDYKSHEGMDPNSFTLYHDKIKSTGCAVSGWSINGSVTELSTSVSFIGKKASTNNTSKTRGTVTHPVCFEPQKTRISIGGSPLLKLNAWSLEVQNIWAIADYITPMTAGSGDINAGQSIAQTAFEGDFSATLPLETQAYGFIGSNAVSTVVVSNTTVYDSKSYTFTITFDIMWDTPDAPADSNNIWAINLKGKIINKTPKAIEFTYVAPAGS